MAIEDLRIAPNCENRSSTLGHLHYSLLQKDFLHRAPQNLSLLNIYDVFECRTLFMRLLKQGIFNHAKVTNGDKQFYSRLSTEGSGSP